MAMQFVLQPFIDFLAWRGFLSPIGMGFRFLSKPLESVRLHGLDIEGSGRETHVPVVVCSTHVVRDVYDSHL